MLQIKTEDAHLSCAAGVVHGVILSKMASERTFDRSHIHVPAIKLSGT